LPEALASDPLHLHGQGQSALGSRSTTTPVRAGEHAVQTAINAGVTTGSGSRGRGGTWRRHGCALVAAALPFFGGVVGVVGLIHPARLRPTRRSTCMALSSVPTYLRRSVASVDVGNLKHVVSASLSLLNSLPLSTWPPGRHDCAIAPAPGSGRAVSPS
jgi:hypothetical protein